jgi:2-oxoglutarate dehydrogenase E1 component
MNKTDQRAAFEETSFLYGGNARFVEDLYAKFLANPSAVDAHWRQFFASLSESGIQVKGPSWQRADWPLFPTDETWPNLRLQQHPPARTSGRPQWTLSVP